MQKYRDLLLNNVRKQINIWFDKEYIQGTPHEEVYRFLHSVTGTASTIGLHEIGDSARELLDQLKESDQKDWEQRELRVFLMPLLSICYYNESDEAHALTNQFQSKGNKPLILLIDDDPTFLMFVKEELEKEDILVMALTDPSRAVSMLYDLKPDCIIIDVYMKSTSGFDVLHYLKDKMKQQFIPTIMISMDHQKEVRMKSYQMGADDFIAKPFDMDEFIVRIRRQLERKELIDHLVLIDELTLVYNRKYLNKVFEIFQQEILRNSENLSLAILDLDHFKTINDTYGHIAGDEVLRRFANFLKQQLNSADIIIRYGGEEFVLLLPRTNMALAKTTLEEILDQFKKEEFIINGQSFTVTFSGGVVEVTNGNQRVEDWIDLADSALYEAKNTGRSCIKSANTNDSVSHKKVVKVGIVDDDPIIRTMIIEMIEKMQKEESVQLEVEAFRDGAKFIESDWYKSSDQYILLLDGMMPRMDGLEVLQRLRSEKESDRYTIVMLTSRKSEQDITRGLKLGADDYMTKPFNLLELEARLKRLVQRVK
ncbi:diguanylate cyclase [Bacillus sp. AK128]